MKRWAQRINDAKRRGYFESVDHCLADGYTTCAVGEAFRDHGLDLADRSQPPYPDVRDLYGEEMWRAKRPLFLLLKADAEIDAAACRFERAVAQNEFTAAGTLLADIQRNAAEWVERIRQEERIASEEA